MSSEKLFQKIVYTSKIVYMAYLKKFIKVLFWNHCDH